MLWFLSPPRKPDDSLFVTFHLVGGQSVTTRGVKEVKASKTPLGGFASYSIEWHEGHKPPMFTFNLEHISAITVCKE